MPRDRAFDSIIVGAGSAGCVLANRLSADPERSVLLIEAGGRDRNPLFRLPMLMGRLFHSGIYNWRYHTEPVPSLGGRALYWPRGKVLGGSSTINGMIYVRGNRHDYDRWAQMGLGGWSYDDVLPAFCRSEGHVERDGAYHGTGGELTVCRARGANPLFEAFVEAGRQAGWPVNDDFNGAEQQGFGRYDFTIRRGKRCSTSAAFLRPIRHRRNLAIATGCLVRRVVLDGGRATGVEVAEGSATRTIHAEREVILCAGTVNSPQLLMLSGIGPGEELKRHGIPVVHELPGVGRNLQDHVDCVLAYACTKPVNGQRTLVKAIAGLADVTGGDIHLSGTDARRASPAQRRALGLRVIPFERNSEGLSLTSALWENWSVRELLQRPLFSFVDPAALQRRCDESLKAWGVRYASAAQNAGALSGGNAQKIILAREINKDARLIIAAQPARGLDIGATAFVWSALREAAGQGCGVLLISSDLDELFDISDRLVVMLSGRIAGAFAPPYDLNTVGRAMTGASA